MSLIPEYTLRKIQQSVPVLCVDVLLKCRGKYILIKRKENPLKGVYWVIGGRVWKNETTEEAAIRKIKEETNLTPSSLKMVGIYDDQYEEGSSLGKFDSPYHTVAIVFEGEVEDLKYFSLDATSDDWCLSDTPPARFKVTRFE